MGARAGYRGAHRGEGEEEENKYEVDQSQRTLDEYVRIVHKNTEFFSTYDADTLFSVLTTFATDQGFTCDVSKDKYKAKIHILLESGESVDLTARVLKVDAEK